MPIINCPDCGHLKAFHHGMVGFHVTTEGSSCSKKSLNGCHFSVEIDKEKFLECECNKSF